uniref:Ig-like domain-containing protein n=1 Tax=Cyprinus carpio TaxID=7962 RepID=A0A8C1WUR2_CYPCA
TERLKSVIVLYRLSYCGVTDEGCAALASALRSNPSHLRQLDLSVNKLGASGVNLLSDLKDDPHYKLETLEIIQISSSDVSEHNVTLLRFRLNENITMNCSINDRFTNINEMAWYHQNPESGRLTLLLSAKSWSSLHIEYSQNRRMRVHGDRKNISLDIIGLMESDSGLYFCGITNLIMYFDKPIRLVMEG